MSIKRSATGLFLLELLVVILFFSISAAVCLRMFTAARLAASYSDNVSLAVVQAQSAAECFKTARGDLADAASLLGAEATETGLIAYYDKAWEICGESDAVFTLTLTANGYEAHISVADEKTEYVAIDAVAAARLYGEVAA